VFKVWQLYTFKMWWKSPCKNSFCL